MLPRIFLGKGCEGLEHAHHKSRNTQPQSEKEPQNEAPFADCAIFGDRRLFGNAEVALAFLGKI